MWEQVKKKKKTDAPTIFALGLVAIVCFIAFWAIRDQNKIVGTYVGKPGTLWIEANNEWSYYEEEWLHTIEWNGTYSKVENGIYQLDCEVVTLYAEIEDDNKLYVYSDDSRWHETTFYKISSKIEGIEEE